MGGVREYSVGQRELFLPQLDDLVAAGHPARGLSDLVDRLDLDAFTSAYAGPNAPGAPRFSARMMVKVMLFGLGRGVRSSRELARAVRENVVFMWLAGRHEPAWRTFAEFRQRHRDALAGLFAQTVRLAAQLRVPTLGDWAVDGSKIAANASRARTLSGEKLDRLEAVARAEADAALAEAAAIDGAEGPPDGDREDDAGRPVMPPELRLRRQRLAKIEAAKAELARRNAATSAGMHTNNDGADDRHDDVGEADTDDTGDPPPCADGAAADSQVYEAAPGNRHKRGKHKGKKARNQKKRKKRSKSANSIRRSGSGVNRSAANLTDPDARIMYRVNGSTMPAYNAQIAVATESQIIVAADVTTDLTDYNQLMPTVQQGLATTSGRPDGILADAGYDSIRGISDLEAAGITGYVALQPTASGGRYTRADFMYNESDDTWSCPAGRILHYWKHRYDITAGRRVRSSVYRCESCAGCGLADRCKRAEAEVRTLRISEFDGARERMRKRLAEPAGAARYSRRQGSVEPAFGILKSVMQLRSFLSRSLAAVRAEFMTAAAAFNLRKLAATPATGR
jgi:transposase